MVGRIAGFFFLISLIKKKYDVILAQTEEAIWFSRVFLQFQLVFILCFSILRHSILIVQVTGKLRDSWVVAVSTHLISHLSESFAKNRNILNLLRKSISWILSLPLWSFNPKESEIYWDFIYFADLEMDIHIYGLVPLSICVNLTCK